MGTIKLHSFRLKKSLFTLTSNQNYPYLYINVLKIRSDYHFLHSAQSENEVFYLHVFYRKTQPYNKLSTSY